MTNKFEYMDNILKHINFKSKKEKIYNDYEKIIRNYGKIIILSPVEKYKKDLRDKRNKSKIYSNERLKN